MRKNVLIPAAILLFTLSCTLFSCKKTAQHSTKIVFDSIVVEERIPLLEINDTTLPYADVKVSFIYPSKFGSQEDLARLQQIFTGTFFNDIQLDTLSPREATDHYVARYREEYTSLSNNYYSDKSRLPKEEMPMWYWYYMYNTNKMMFQNDSLLSFAVEYSDYTGGAHGSHRITYVNVDLNDLTTLTEEDLFVSNYQKPLTEIIVHRLMVQNNLSSPDSLIHLGFFNIDEIFPNDNFWLNQEGVHYAYNQYEIAPYAMGVIHVDIPYSDLKDILKPGNVLQKFFPEKKNQ